MKQKKSVEKIEGSSSYDEVQHLKQHPLWYLLQRRGGVLCDIEREKDNSMKLGEYSYLSNIDQAIIEKLWREKHEQ